MLASGRGPNEAAAIAAAKRQLLVDVKSGGMLKDCYRQSDPRIIDVTRTGGAFVAVVEADMVKETASRRVAFVLAGDMHQRPRLMAIVQRLRTALADQRPNGQPLVGVTEAVASGPLSVKSLSDIQTPGFTEAMGRLAHEAQAESVYVMIASSENAPVFLVGGRPDSATKKVRTLRDPSSGGDHPMSRQVTDAVRKDLGLEALKMSPPVMLSLPAPGKQVHNGQSVAIYDNHTTPGGIKESTIVTYGVITEVSRTTVRVVLDDPLIPEKGRNWRLTPSPALLAKRPQRGVVIKESDW